METSRFEADYIVLQLLWISFLRMPMPGRTVGQQTLHGLDEARFLLV